MAFRGTVTRLEAFFRGVPANSKPRKEIPLCSDYVLAVRKWAELSARHASAAPAVNFIEVIDIYEKIELHKLAKSTQATHQSDLKHLREFFGQPAPAPLDEIKPSHIRTLLKWKAKQPTTANRLKRLFSTIFNFARGEGYTDKENPTKGITGFELGRREVDITEPVYQAVWAEADEPLRDAMDLAEVIGQRPGDVLRLTEHDIKDGLLSIKQGKTRAKAADDTAEVLGEQAAADLLGHDSVQTTKNHYLRRGLIVGPSK
jgi:integrase